MDTQSRLNILTEVYDKMNGAIFTKDSPAYNLDRQLLDRVTSAIIAPGPYYYFIFDCYRKVSIYVNDTISDFYDVEQKDFSIGTVMEHIHPDDAAHLFACEAAAAEFLIKNVNVSDFPYYKVSHCYRIRNKSGNYQMILHQGIAFKMDENGLMNQTLILHTDISHLTDENDKLFSLIGLHGRPSFIALDPYNNIKSLELPHLLFTKRQIEILRLLANGLSGKLIADELNISVGTVRTHKQNMLKKARVRNSVELITKVIQLKII